MNWADFLIVCALGVALFFAGRSIRRTQKSGGCCCGCKGCSCSRSCGCADFGASVESADQEITSGSENTVKNLLSGADSQHPEV